MSGLLTTFPIQLACQLITPGNDSLHNSTLHSPLLQQPTILPNGYTAYPDIGVAMKYYSNDLLWNVARKHCIMEGGNLAVMDSIEKCQYGNALRKSNPRGAMLGIHKLFDKSEWVSAKTGLPLPFIPWRSGGDNSPTAPSCTALWGDSGGRVGAWDCNQSWSYLCEIPLFHCYNSEVQPLPIQLSQAVSDEGLNRTDAIRIEPN